MNAEGKPNRYTNMKAIATTRPKTKTPAKKAAVSKVNKPKTVTPPKPAPAKPASAPEPVKKVAPTPPAQPQTPEPSAEVVLTKVEGKTKHYVSKTEPDSKYHLRNRSSATKPCHIVRELAAANPTLPRKDVIALCLEAGVDKNTAATQYSLWKAKQPFTTIAQPVKVPTPAQPGEFEEVFQAGNEDEGNE